MPKYIFHTVFSLLLSVYSLALYGVGIDNIRFDFPDYSDDELIDVLIRFAQADGRTVGPEALAEARRLLAEKRDRPGFGNARDVRSLFSAAKRHQISRLADERSLHEVQPERVRTLLPVDFAQSMI